METTTNVHQNKSTKTLQRKPKMERQEFRFHARESNFFYRYYDINYVKLK